MPTLARSVLLLLALAMASCSNLPHRDPVQVTVVGVKPLAGQDLEVRFLLQLRIQNPNERALEYHGVALDLALEDQPLASGVSAEQGRIPAFGEAVVSVPMSISAFSMLRQAWQLGATPPGTVPMHYRLGGKLSNGLFGTQRFEEHGDWRWPLRP